MSEEPINRCRWANSDPVMARYHDEEWGIPVFDSRELWECLMLEGFQAGLSWSTILNRRDGFRAAFAGFNPETVANFGEGDVSRLLQDPGIIRSKAKIDATINGARIFLAMTEPFSDVVWRYVDGKPIINTTGEVPAKTALSEQISADLKKLGFKFVGPVIVYAWMQAIGMVDDHAPDCFRRA